MEDQEELEEYYTDVDREVLELTDYFKQVISQVRAEGIHDKDEELKLRILNNMPRIVNDHAGRVKDYRIAVKNNDESLMAQRLVAECPVCKSEQKVKITGETINDRFNWALDIVECLRCHTGFTNFFTNN